MAALDKSGEHKEKFLNYRLLDYVRILQIASWFVPISPILKPANKKIYAELEPLFKSVESDSLYSTLESRLQKISLYWKG